MKVLVIGGTRYFGKRLVNRLIEESHDVTILTRGKAKDSFGNKVRRLVGDRRDQNQLDLLTRDLSWDVIVDQVCMKATDAMSALEIFRNKTNKYIVTSSQSVYDQGSLIAEGSFKPHQYDFSEVADENTDYKSAKKQVESVFAKANHFALTLLRLPIVLGEDDYTGRLKFHIERISTGQPIYFPNLDARISFVSSEDAANALLRLSKIDDLGPVNVASKEPLRLADLITQISDTVGKKPKLLDTQDTSHWSPFGIHSDWYMDVKWAEANNVRARRTEEWLPQLVEDISRRVRSQAHPDD